MSADVRENDREALAALIARWNYEQSYAFNRDIGGEANAGTPWNDLDDEHRAGVIPTGYPLADVILAAGWTCSTRNPYVVDPYWSAHRCDSRRRNA